MIRRNPVDLCQCLDGILLIFANPYTESCLPMISWNPVDLDQRLEGIMLIFANDDRILLIFANA